MTGEAAPLYALPVIVGANAVINRKLVRAFAETGGMLFAFLAYGYYSTLYAFAVAIGAVIGMAEYILE
jgi:hypothetical protein